MYDYRTVNAALDWVRALFHGLHYQLGKPMPSNFDFQFFFKGIDTMLEMDALLSCEKCLWLIYKIAHLLPSMMTRDNACVCVDKERGILLYKKILGQNFYKLFFHWSFNIRLLMHHLMLYQCRNWFEHA